MRPRRRCAVIAHRGGAREVPENTWSAVEHVESLGLTWMETDLHATADDVVVLSHDADLGRIGGRGTLSELTWDEAAELDAGDGRGLVRLDEVLEAHPGLALNVDLKEPAVVQPALQVVRAADALDRVRFASFSARRLAAARALGLDAGKSRRRAGAPDAPRDAGGDSALRGPGAHRRPRGACLDDR